MSQPSLAGLLHFSVSAVAALHMLCENLQAVSYVFNVRRIFHQISPVCMPIHTIIFWSGNGILFNTLQISPACSMHIGLLKELETLQYFTILAIQGSGEKMPQPSINNHLNFFCSFLCQADLNTNIEDESRSFYGVSSQYESPENMVITCSTKVCSFGKQVVEKVEVRSRHMGARFPLTAVLSLPSICILPLSLKAKYISCILSGRWMP